ncbi:MAG: non-reducing end alpha-L-arabinofuranosidase family hydrolase [Myxococcales bacterium]
MPNLLRTALALFLTTYLSGCSSGSDDGNKSVADGQGGQSSGGASSSGSSKVGKGGSGTIGKGGSGAVGKGGSDTVGEGGSDTVGEGGSSTVGKGGSGTVGKGGSLSSGAATGGNSQGGATRSSGSSSSKSKGGSSAGGSSSTAMGTPTGGVAQSKGGAPSGGSGGAGTRSSTGGQANPTGGTSSTSGGTTCPMPSTFKWTSGGPVANPASGWDSIKDFSYAPYNGKHLIYMTMHSGSSYGAAMMTFTDWSAASSATQNKLSFAAVAPTIFYFTPKQTWVLAYQWGATGFSYRTSSDPTNPNGWSAEKSLYASKSVPAGSSSTGVIDQQVICDAAKCYLYFTGDNGYVYRSSMAIGSFPGEFPAATTLMQDTPQKLFEAIQVFSIKGSNKYLLLVEAQGNGRYFRAWTTTDLGGSWTLLTDTFAAKSNTTFSQNWTTDISHGDMVRAGADETFPIDPCNLQLIYQGRDPNSTVAYDKLPYKLGLLTAAK